MPERLPIDFLMDFVEFRFAWFPIGSGILYYFASVYENRMTLDAGMVIYRLN